VPARLFLIPVAGSPTTRHNWQATQKEALSFGPTDAAASFLPVLLARLGASGVQVGLLTAIPNLAGFVLALPVGHLLQTRRNVVPWYSRSRLINQFALAAIAVALIAVPAEHVIPVILAIMGASAIVGSFANMSFYTVMDGLSGPNGRYELMGRRWGMKGGATAISLAVIGWTLAEVPFPLSYELVFLATAIAALAGFRYSRTFRIPDHVRTASHEVRASVPARLRAFAREMRGERRFLGFLGRHTVFSIGVNMAVPLIPLYYVRHLGATDAWIGLIGTTQALLTMTGYFLWKRTARRHGGTHVLLLSTLGTGAFPAVLALTGHELAVAALVGVYGICLAGIELAIFDELMQAVPVHQATRFAALDTGFVNFAGMVGPIAGALVAGSVGIPAGLLVAAAVTVAGAAMFAASAMLRRRRRSPEPETAVENVTVEAT
jgi:MFS family permease